MNKLRVGVLAVFAFLAACTAQPPPAETTPDGLTRVPSRTEGGVYRKLDADFTRYKRLMIEPLTVEFLESWRTEHKKDVDDTELRRIQLEAAQDFREVFTKILIDEGPFEFADVREPDVFVVVPRLVDLKIPAPESELGSDKTLVAPPVSLQMTGELRDGVNGDLLMRVIRIESEHRYGYNAMRMGGRINNAHEIKLCLERWSRLLREAIDVAKSAKPAVPPTQ